VLSTHVTTVDPKCSCLEPRGHGCNAVGWILACLLLRRSMWHVETSFGRQRLALRVILFCPYRYTAPQIYLLSLIRSIPWLAVADCLMALGVPSCLASWCCLLYHICLCIAVLSGPVLHPPSAHSLAFTQGEREDLRDMHLAEHQAKLLEKQNEISVRSTQPEVEHAIGTRVRFQQGEAGQHTGFVCGWSVSGKVGVGSHPEAVFRVDQHYKFAKAQVSVVAKRAESLAVHLQDQEVQSLDPEYFVRMGVAAELC